MSIPMEDLTTTPTEMTVQENRIVSHSKLRRIAVNRLQIIKNEIKELFTFHPKEWLDAFRFNSSYPLFVKGDIDGFVALFINTLSTLLAVILSLQPVLGNDIVYGKIVPG